MKLNFLILTAISSGIIDYAQAENSQTTLSEPILNNRPAHKDRLSKIYESLSAARADTSNLDRDIKELIHNYKNHLQKFEAAQKIGEANNSLLLKDIGLLLAKLEAGQETQIKDQMQAKSCYELISAIESLFEKLENPQEDSFDGTAFPSQSKAIVGPYKKLKGEKLPYHVKSNKKKKRQYEGDDLPPVSLAQVKISTLLPETLEDDK